MKRKANQAFGSRLSHQLLAKPESELPLMPQSAKKQKIRHPYTIDRIPLDDPEYTSQTPHHLQNKELPGFPSTVIAVGEPGSGKTNLLINLLVRKDFWNGFYDKVFYLGPTINADASYKVLTIPNERKVTDQDEFIPKLEEWVAEQVQLVEHDRKTAPKCLFIFEDITAYYYTAQQSPTFAKCFTTIRHHKSTAYANIHKFKALNRTARQAGRHVMVWPVTLSEQSVIYEDYAPKNLDKNDFFFMCAAIWKPDEDPEGQQKPFLFINKFQPEEKRYRRCFTDIINLDMFKGIHKRSVANPQQDPYFLEGTGDDNSNDLANGLSNSRKRKRCMCCRCKCKCCSHPGNKRTSENKYNAGELYKPLAETPEKRKELSSLTTVGMQNSNPSMGGQGTPNATAGPLLRDTVFNYLR